MTPGATSSAAGAPRQARDVMALGQEHGRVLSDGRIIGRAEPFAKVFPSSRVVKRVVGLTAWGILEDIALDATLDAEGRLVAETSVRRIATNLGLNKETVTRHLARLRGHGFVLHEEVRQRGSGRWETARYVLDPSACLERFTTTPPPQTPRSAPCTDFPYAVNPDTRGTVSGFTGHGESVHAHLEDVVVEDEEQQQQTGHAALLERLGVDPVRARMLAARHSPARVQAVVDAARRRARNPAGWVIRALEDGWELPAAPAPEPNASATPSAPERRPPEPPDPPTPAERRHWQGWDAAVSAALDDADLFRAVRAACAPAPGVGWVLPVVRAELIGWAAATHARRPDTDLRQALLAALDGDPAPLRQPRPAPELPEPPPRQTMDPAPLRDRLTRLLPTPKGDPPRPETDKPRGEGAQP